MSTRSNILIKRKNKKVESIYCHWDGYLSYNGKILLENYNDINKINELINLGDLSSLGKLTRPLGNDHTFDTPEKDVCVAYGRDRGESNVDKRTWDNLKEYLKQDLGFIDYIYMFDEENNKWYYANSFEPYNEQDFKELTLEEIEEERN